MVEKPLAAVSHRSVAAAAKAALAPMHTTYAMLSDDIRLYEARCSHHLALHAPVHNAAISKVRSVAAQLWPRAQVKTFGSFATGLMCPGSDIDLIVTLPPVRTTTAMPEAPGTLEGRNALPEETWQASLARCLKDQSWVFPESVRQIDALVPIVSFATRFFVSPVGTADGSSQTGTPLRLDVSFEGLQHNGLATNTFVQRTLAERDETFIYTHYEGWLPETLPTEEWQNTWLPLATDSRPRVSTHFKPSDSYRQLVGSCPDPTFDRNHPDTKSPRFQLDPTETYVISVFETPEHVYATSSMRSLQPVRGLSRATSSGGMAKGQDHG